MQLSKLYTRSGDKGSTHLVGGEKVSKSSYLMELAGSLDELNCFIGQLRTQVIDSQNSAVEIKEHHEVTSYLNKIQNSIFDIGSLISCSPENVIESLPIIESSIIDTLEFQIDKMTEVVPNLPSFVLPGGSPINASAHICRSVCRRVERQLVNHYDDLNDLQRIVPLQFINRLSDWFFAFSRYFSYLESTPEFLWEHPLKKS